MNVEFMLVLLGPFIFPYALNINDFKAQKKYWQIILYAKVITLELVHDGIGFIYLYRKAVYSHFNLRSLWSQVGGRAISQEGAIPSLRDSGGALPLLPPPCLNRPWLWICTATFY